MHLRPANEAHLHSLIKWIDGPEACRLWAGPLVRYPLSLESLKEDLNFSHENTFSMIDNRGGLLALGQLMDKGAGRHHLARIIVSPDKRGCGYGRLLCRQFISKGARRLVGAGQFSLNVYRENVAALRMYERIGFTRSTPTPGAGFGDEVIHMVLQCRSNGPRVDD